MLYTFVYNMEPLNGHFMDTVSVRIVIKKRKEN